MNAALAKLETNGADESDQIRPELLACEPVESPPVLDELPLDERTGRTIYRRSAAYFLFGLGSNKNTIITDEP